MKNLVAPIALTALAALAAPVSAQSSLSLYGVVDASIESVKGVDTLSRLASGNFNSSRLGVKGTEDLGGGLKALFTLEASVAVDTGASASGRFWDRQAWVGLGTEWGDLRLGRTDSSLALVSDRIGTQAFDDLKIVGTRGANNYRRIDNALTYSLPPTWLPGLTGQIQYSFAAVGFGSSGAISSSTAGTEPATGKAGQAWSGNLGYGMGPFYASVGYLDSADENSVTTGKQRARAAIGLASWDFGMAKLTGYYNTETSFGPDRLSTWGAKVAVPVGSSLLVTGGVSVTDGTTTVDGDDDSVRIYSLKGVYSMSKRTALYAWFVFVDNDDAASKGLVTTAAGETGHGLAFGVRHAF